MRSSRAPVGATWLLKQFGCSPKNESLIGDLVEEYRRGRSRIWYWKQVLIAIVVGLLEEIWAHKLLAVRRLAAGWALALVFSSGWILLVQLLRRALPRDIGLVMAMMVMLSCILGFCLGWVIGRFHRPQHRIAVLTFVASWFLCLLTAFFMPPGRMLAFGVLGNILAMLSTLLGGLLSGQQPRGGVRV